MDSGPLDELFPALRAPAEIVPDQAVHPRVLVRPHEGKVDFVILSWRDPGGAQAAHDALRPVVEATLLSELSRPPTHALDLRPDVLCLLGFEHIADVERAVAAFGMRNEAPTPQLLALARGEANRIERQISDEPVLAMQASFESNPLAFACEGRLVRALEKDVFGRRPGAFFAALNAALELEGSTPLPPRATSLDVLCDRLLPKRTGVIRWIPPLCFQGLCDAVAVVSAAELGRETQWGESEPDERGVAQPPVIRVQSPEGWVHIDLGIELLRWCVMPLRSGEDVPPLSEWLRDRIGA